MSKPTVFIASSVEGLDIANAIAHYLKYDARVVTWSGAFDLSNTTIEDLEQRIARVDFGAVVLSPDDQTTMRNTTQMTPRDNVLLELGMLFGRVGRTRTFLVVPSDQEMHLPTDLLGVTPATYDVEWAGEDGNAREALSAAGGEIRAAIKRLGPIDHVISAGAVPPQREGPDSPTAGYTLPSLPIVQAGPGDRHDGWAYFAEQGWLPPIAAAELFATRWVVAFTVRARRGDRPWSGERDTDGSDRTVHGWHRPHNRAAGRPIRNARGERWRRRFADEDELIATRVRGTVSTARQPIRDLDSQG